MDSQVLQNIDHIAEEAIADGSTSGCQVLIARKGKVVFDKSYGYPIYEKENP